MASLAGFDASKVEPSQSFAAIPAGEYRACIVASELKPTKSGTGSYLSLQFQVIGGQFQNKKLFEKLNLANPNAVAVQIAQGTLSAICRAVGILTPSDSHDLHNKPITITVGVRKSDYSGDFENYIKAFKPVGATSPTTPVPTVPTASPVAKAPWQQ